MNQKEAAGWTFWAGVLIVAMAIGSLVCAAAGWLVLGAALMITSVLIVLSGE